MSSFFFKSVALAAHTCLNIVAPVRRASRRFRAAVGYELALLQNKREEPSEWDAYVKLMADVAIDDAMNYAAMKIRSNALNRLVGLDGRGLDGRKTYYGPVQNKMFSLETGDWESID